MSELTEFLLARIAEDEAVALVAATRDWQNVVVMVSAGNGWAVESVFADHAERWTPARVLAECEAKRRIINFAVRTEEAMAHEYGGDVTDADIDGNDALLALAAVYADHSDYDESWRS
jgi:hypothetical protein